MKNLRKNPFGPADRLRKAIHHSVGNTPIHAGQLSPCAIQLQKISGGTGPHNPMRPHRSTGGFHRIDTQQFGRHAGAQEAAPLNRSTVEPLGLKRTNRDTAVDEAGVTVGSSSWSRAAVGAERMTRSSWAGERYTSCWTGASDVESRDPRS